MDTAAGSAEASAPLALAYDAWCRRENGLVLVSPSPRRRRRTILVRLRLASVGDTSAKPIGSCNLPPLRNVCVGRINGAIRMVIMGNKRRPRFLFVYPEIPDTYWSYRYAIRMDGKRALMPPLGLPTVAAMVPREYECRIVDMNVARLTDRDIRWADLVLISAMIVQKDSMNDVVRRCREAGVRIAAGGPYPTSSSEEVVGVDHLILGEAEEVFPDFIADYEAGRPKPRYIPSDKPSMDQTPIPRYELLELSKYRVMPIQFSRGCPFDCEFCDIVQLFGRKVRTKTPERFVAEMEAAYGSGFRGGMFVVDDNFIGHQGKAKEVLRHIIDWQHAHGYPFALSTEASINLAYDEELLELVREAGFNMVFVGLETPVDESLAAAGKQQNRKRDVIESVRAIQKKGIEVSGGFIVGFDSDPPDIFDRQIRFIEELAIPTAMVGLLTALPKTKLHERLEREGRLLGSSAGNNLSSTAMNFRPMLPKELIARGYRRLLETIYAPSRYFNRCLRFLELLPAGTEPASVSRCAGAGEGENAEKQEIAANRREGRRIHPKHLRAAFRSLLRQTFSRYGPHYLLFLARAIRRRPDQLVMIFTMAIQAHHYIKMTRLLFREQRRKSGETESVKRAPNTDPTSEPADAYQGSLVTGTME